MKDIIDNCTKRLSGFNCKRRANTAYPQLQKSRINTLRANPLKPGQWKITPGVNATKGYVQNHKIPNQKLKQYRLQQT